MLQCEKLHREVALLSNELHLYSDDDTESCKPTIDKILEKRAKWTAIYSKIAHFNKFGTLPVEKKQAEKTEEDLKNQAELAKIRVLISQNSKKLKTNPGHKNAVVWESELIKLNGLKKEYETKLKMK